MKKYSSLRKESKLQLSRKGTMSSDNNNNSNKRTGLQLKRSAKLRKNKSGNKNFKEIIKTFTVSIKKTLKLFSISLGIVLALLVVSGIFVAAYFYLIRADYFAIRTVSISGLEKVSREEVLSAIDLTQGNNILDVRLNKMEKSLNLIPWISSVKISRVLPDIIDVKVSEYRAKCLINLGSLYYMDEHGRPFKKVEAGENPNLPIISGILQDDLLEKSEETRNSLKEIFSLMVTLEERNDTFKLDNISEIHFDEVRGLTLYTHDEGLQVKIGFGDYEEKFVRLGQVLAHIKTSGEYLSLVYLNLEAAPRVVARYKEPTV